MRSAQIASVKGLQLTHPVVTTFPGQPPVSIPPSVPFFASSLDMGGEMLFQFDLGLFETPTIVTLPIGMPPREPPPLPMEAMEVPEMAGTRFLQPPSLDDVAPPPLLRAYTPLFERGGLKPAGQNVVAVLKPLLEPKLRKEETRDLLLPLPLREDQIEALDKLLSHDHLLFADDRGSGKRAVVAVALRALMQEKDAERILILCSEEGLRAWARVLTQWAGSLSVTLVRGDLEQRLLDWRTPARVYLAHYPTFFQDRPRLDDADLRFDTLVLDNLLVESRRGELDAAALTAIPARRRWGLCGAQPERREEWLNVFQLLEPGSVKRDPQATLPDLREQFLSKTLRRDRRQIKGIPGRVREVIWLDMDASQSQTYQETLAEERYRLRKLGGTLTRTHIYAAVERMKVAGSFGGEGYNSVKVRTLVNLMEDISAAGKKAVVFTHAPRDTRERLEAVLSAYGLLSIEADVSSDEGAQVMARFREDESVHVLLADTHARSDGQMLPQASYIIHFDYDWNPANRLRAEHRFFPNLHREVPLQIYELAVVRTLDEPLQELLAQKRMLPGQLARGTRPAELEEKTTVAEWLTDVFGLSSTLRETQDAAGQIPGSGPLPSTGYLRERFEEQSPQAFMELIGDVLEALGFPAWKLLGEADESGGDLLASRAEIGEVECILVRVFRTDNNVGIASARKALKDAENRPGCMSAQLITTADFTSACKKFAAEADEKLGLMTGAELYRHLRILGQLI